MFITILLITYTCKKGRLFYLRINCYTDGPNFKAEGNFWMKGVDLIPRRKFARLLITAASLHLLLVIAIYSTGRSGLWPTMFDTNGIGLPFAADCIGYRLEAISLTETLIRQGVMPWLAASSQYLVNPFHIKLYSLSFLAFGPLLGYNILATEPLNLLYYLSILYLVFMLGREVFGERTGLLAAWAVALWPSLLLHTTQFFRDPLFIASMLGLILIGARFLTRDYSWTRGLKTGAGGSALTVLLWLLRREMWEVMLAILLVTAGLLIIKQLHQRRVLAGNLLSIALILLVTLALPRVWNAIEHAGYPEAQNAALNMESLPPGSSLQMRIMQLRHGFTVSYPNAGSNIDADVEFSSLADIILYLPRAVLIGFFAPFPNMWVTAGPQAGLKGRLLSGAETFLIYIVTLLAFVALWHHRRKLSVWLLLLGAGTGMTALGFVVANVATLYRMRYAYWILLIILGAEGFRQISPKWLQKEDYESRGRLENDLTPKASLYD